MDSKQVMMHYIFLLPGWSIDDPYRGPSMNDKDHIVGPLTRNRATFRCNHVKNRNIQSRGLGPVSIAVRHPLGVHF